MFKNVEKYDGDPILSFTETFHTDPRPDKVNHGIALYYNEERVVPEFHAITPATECLARKHAGARVYLPMTGLKTYRDAVGKLLFEAKGLSIRHRGLFSCSGMSPAQVKGLLQEHSMYILNSGRMCLAGLNFP